MAKGSQQKDPVCTSCGKNTVPKHVMPADRTPVCDPCQRAASEGKGS